MHGSSQVGLHASHDLSDTKKPNPKAAGIFGRTTPTMARLAIKETSKGSIKTGGPRRIVKSNSNASLDLMDISDGGEALATRHVRNFGKIRQEHSKLSRD